MSTVCIVSLEHIARGFGRGEPENERVQMYSIEVGKEAKKLASLRVAAAKFTSRIIRRRPGGHDVR